MAGTTSVPPIQFTLTGLVLPDDSALLAGVQADQNAAFGGDLNPALVEPQGQLATTQTACISNANATFAEFVNQVNPDTADGFMQDAIGRIYFMQRIAGTPTAVLATVTGLFGTVLPVNSQAQDTSGNLYLSTQAVTIPSSGTVTVPFANAVDGPIACPSGTLSIIYQAIPGWDSITNASAGVVGTNVETRAAFEFRRVNSVALNSQGSLPAIYAALFDPTKCPGVLDVYATQNNTGSTVNTGSTAFPIPAKSVYVAVVGGNSAQVAFAIWNAVNLGALYSGNTTVNVQDPSPYQVPIPTYPVKFETPTDTPIFYTVNIASAASLPANIVALVQAAVVAQFTGANGGNRARIASDIFASSYYAPVAATSTVVQIVSIFIGVAAAPTSGNSVQMGIDQAPTIQPSNVSVNLV